MKRMIGLLVALAVVAAASFAVLAQARPASTASPARSSRSADVTFTKWVTSLPADPSKTLAGSTMVGVVGGDVGQGRFAAMLFSDDTTSRKGFWLGRPLYGFFGSEHSFVANNFITENDTVKPITAAIHGVVIMGWMKGARVTGEYTQRDTCPIPTPGNKVGTTCFEGTLHLQR